MTSPETPQSNILLADLLRSRSALPDKSQARKKLACVCNFSNRLQREWQKQIRLVPVRSYVRTVTEDCFDLLFLIPKEYFFDEGISRQVQELFECLKKEYPAGELRIAQMLLPWTERVNALHLEEDGFCLLPKTGLALSA